MQGPASVSAILENIYAVDGPCEPDVEVRALLVGGREYTLLIDTLARPSDLEPVRAVVEGLGRPLLIANSHADWDHWWGNAAFPQSPVIAHRLTLERQRREGRRSLLSHQRRDPEFFAGVELRPATIAFDGQLDLDLGGIHVELHHVPGHTRDSLVAWVPERRLLFAADAAEVPIPLINEGPVGDWPDRLDRWAEQTLTVVPAHGPVSGPDLLTRNAAYLRGLCDPARAVQELEGAPAFYRRAHRGNIKRAAAGSVS